MSLSHTKPRHDDTIKRARALGGDVSIAGELVEICEYLDNRITDEATQHEHEVAALRGELDDLKAELREAREAAQ